MRPLKDGCLVLIVSVLIGIGISALRASPGTEFQQRDQDVRSLLDTGYPTLSSPTGPHEFYFTRAIYSSGWGYNRWAIDFPKADRQFMTVVNRLIGIDGSPRENAIRLDDPNLRKYPFLYALEVGDITLNSAES